MKLEMTINNIKSIKNLHISLPLEKGLYAITGQNGSGKSTVITCASSAYFNMQMNEYFGKTPDDAAISFELNGAKKEWRKTGGRWQGFFQGSFQLKGFYEGSIIFGNRFRNTKYDLLMRLDRIDDSRLQLTSDFIKTNLGKILHNYESRYDRSKDGNGKNFYSILDDELRDRGRTRNEIIEIVLEYLIQHKNTQLESLKVFLKETLE